MEIQHYGSFHTAYMNTGPRHWYLGLTLRDGPSPDPPVVTELPAAGGGCCGGGDPAKIVEYVLAGVATGNELCGTNYGVECIQYRKDDSRAESAYGSLAREIIKSLSPLLKNSDPVHEVGSAGAARKQADRG